MTSENIEEMVQEERPTAQTAPPPEVEEASGGKEATLAAASEEGQVQRKGRLPGGTHEEKAGRTDRDSARWPPAVALLNLTGWAWATFM